MNLTKSLKEWAVKNCDVKADATDADFRKTIGDAIFTNKLNVVDMVKMQAIDAVNDDRPTALDKMFGAVDDAGNGGGSGDGGDVRIKSIPAVERYKSTKVVGKHDRLGIPIRDERGREVELPSELEFAKAGALFKLFAKKQGLPCELTDHERELVEASFRDPWCGMIGSQWKTGIDGLRVKTLLTDATSGGTYVVPEWFDEDVITTPLLSGELAPMITWKDVPRGTAVEGASIGNPTVSWGTAEGSQISLFDTDSLIGEVNTTIYPVAGSVEVGRDHLADSPVDVGRTLMENLGRSMAAEIDKVIAGGSGTSRPTGIQNAAGISSVTPSGGAGADQTVADYEGLIFAVGKQYRTGAGARCAFLANDTTYSRARGIAVGATDQRRVFGMETSTHASYTILGYPFKIQNDLTNPYIFFGDMSKYRMYRRKGMEVRWVTEGKELARKNLALLLVRSRMGGRVVDSNAFAKITNGKA